MSSRLTSMVLSLGILFVFAFPLSAQKPAESASVAVHVTDSAGDAIPNATVQVLPSPEPIGKKLATDRSGNLLLQVPPGNYDLTVNAMGFHVGKNHIDVKDGTPEAIEIELQVGECTQCAEVQAADYPHLDTSPVPLSDSLTVACDERSSPAQLLPKNPVYDDSKKLAHTLDALGMPVRCIFSSKVQHVFKGQRGAALYRIDDGSFEVIFLREAETFNRVGVAENVLDTGTGINRYKYSFLGTPRSSTALSVSKRSYFIKQGNMLFYIWGDEQLAANLQSKLSQMDLLDRGSSVR